MLGDGELAARLAEAIDDFNGQHVGGRHGFFALGDVAAHDVVQADELPQPACQPDVAKLAWIGPDNLAQTHAHDIGLVEQGEVLVVGEQTQLLGIALSVVKDDGALPAPFLIVIEFTQVSDDTLSRPGSGTNALDERVVAVSFTLLGPLVASQKHPCLLGASMVRQPRQKQGARFPLQRQNAPSTTKTQRIRRT